MLNLLMKVYFERLDNIAQLGVCHYYFEFPYFSRLSHSLMVMRVAEHLCRLLEKNDKNIVIAAFLHDFGHSPFSHDLEPLLIEYTNKNHEDQTIYILKKSEVIRNFIKNNGCKVSRIISILKSKHPIIFQKFPYVLGADKISYIFHDSIVMEIPQKMKILLAISKILSENSLHFHKNKILPYNNSENYCLLINRVYRTLWKKYYLSKKFNKIRSKLIQSVKYCIVNKIIDAEEIWELDDYHLLKILLKNNIPYKDFIKNINIKLKTSMPKTNSNTNFKQYT